MSHYFENVLGLLLESRLEPDGLINRIEARWTARLDGTGLQSGECGLIECSQFMVWSSKKKVIQFVYPWLEYFVSSNFQSYPFLILFL